MSPLPGSRPAAGWDAVHCGLGVNWGVACGRSIHQTRLNSTPGVCNTSYRLEMSRLKLQCAVSTDIDTVSMQIVSQEREEIVMLVITDFR